MTSAVTASLDQKHALFVSSEHTRALPGSRAGRRARPGVAGSLGVLSGLLTERAEPEGAVDFPERAAAVGAAGGPVRPRTRLSAIMVGLCALWYAVLAAEVARLRPVFTQAGVRRRLDQITGTLLVGLGTRLALDKSPVGVT